MSFCWFKASGQRLAEAADVNSHPVAILPLGAIEAHGPHIPLGTDTILAERLLDQAETEIAAEDLATFRMPALWLGASTEHADQRGTIDCEPEQLISSVMAVAHAVYRTGIKRLVLFNAHGGNIPALNIAALKARRDYGLLAVSTHWLDFDLPSTITAPGPVREDVHGGWLETSLMLYLAPELVTMSEAKANTACQHGQILYPHGSIQWGWMTSDLTKGGWVGRPDLATKEMGRLLTDHISKNFAALIKEVSGCPWEGTPQP